MRITIDKEMKDTLSYMADGFSLAFTAVSGLIAKFNVTILSVHTVASETFFIVGGILSLVWLSFRALSGYYAYKKAKKEFNE
jgi:hypothetical protein